MPSGQSSSCEYGGSPVLPAALPPVLWSEETWGVAVSGADIIVLLSAWLRRELRLNPPCRVRRAPPTGLPFIGCGSRPISAHGRFREQRSAGRGRSPGWLLPAEER